VKSIILAGGKGIRLWPLSRQEYPKQFLKLIDGKSLLESTYERVLNLVNPEDMITITNKDYYFYVKDICSKFPKILEENIISEPVGRNTAPAIALAIQFIIEKLNTNSNEVLFVFPSDHIIEPVDKFIKYMLIGKEVAEKGYLVLFGIKPDRPETGYGYIKVGECLGNFNKVKEFTEKPNLQTAKKYLKEGSYLWNSGIFAFKISTFLEELKLYQPQIYENISRGYEEILKSFFNIPSISVDYAIMEKSKRIVIVPMNIYWNDIGSWESFYEIKDKDINGNVFVGDVCPINTKNSLIFSNKRLVATVGIENVIVIETDDVVLMLKKGNGQDIKELLDKLQKRKREEVINSLEVYRSWGHYKILDKGEGYKIKRVVIKPRGTLTLHTHNYRTEHWIIIKGTVEIQIGEGKYLLQEGESMFASKLVPHKLWNSGNTLAELIEIQMGEYIGEDDIISLEDEGKGK